MGRAQYCLFTNDRRKQASDDETDTPDTFNGNYIGGIDVKNSIHWTTSDPVFIGIQGRTRVLKLRLWSAATCRRFPLHGFSAAQPF